MKDQNTMQTYYTLSNILTSCESLVDLVTEDRERFSNSELRKMYETLIMLESEGQRVALEYLKDAYEKHFTPSDDVQEYDELIREYFDDFNEDTWSDEFYTIWNGGYEQWNK